MKRMRKGARYSIARLFAFWNGAGAKIDTEKAFDPIDKGNII